MKNLFPQYATLPAKDHKRIWHDGIFVFDTNVLLSIYRYQPKAREQLLEVLTKLADRIWMPHQVALEFYRNRLAIIAEQIKRFTEAKNAVDQFHAGLIKGLKNLDLEKRHSLINPERLLSGVQTVVSEFHEMLEQLRSSQQSLTGPDPIRSRLEALFEDKVGPPILSQIELNQLYKEAEERFALDIPPGYMDSDKDKKSHGKYVSGGLIHQLKYGDYIVWAQLLQHAKSAQISAIVFVTDDNKEDWWQKVTTDGPNTIGARPELLEEIRAEAGVEEFLMYNSENFLKYAKEFLEAKVSTETLDEVREVAAAYSPQTKPPSILTPIINAVIVWAEQRYGVVAQSNASKQIDFVIIDGGKKTGFEVMAIAGSLPTYALASTLNHLISGALSQKLDAIHAVIIVSHRNESDALKMGFLSLGTTATAVPVWITTGSYDGELDSFSPFDSFSASRGLASSHP